MFIYFQTEVYIIVFNCSDETYYLTWKHMSSQGRILGVFSSQELWTALSKDQYLPAYFKQICDDYLLSDDNHRVFPVEVSGLLVCLGYKYLQIHTSIIHNLHARGMHAKWHACKCVLNATSVW